MLRTVNWLARSLGFAADGLLTFLSLPRDASGQVVPFAVPVQVICYCVLGAAMLGWALLDLYRPAARHRAAAMPVVLGVMSAAAGAGAAAGGGGTSMVAFGFVAAMVA